MLTSTQRAMLDARRSNFEKVKETRYEDRKYVDYTLRQYVKKQFDSLSDLLEVLKTLPKDQIESVLTPKQMIDCLKVLGKAMEILPPVAIKRTEDGKQLAVRTYTLDFGSALTGMGEAKSRVNVTCPALEDEIKYWNMFWISKNVLFEEIVNNIEINPAKFTLKEFNRDVLPALNKMANKRGAFCTVEPIDNVSGIAYSIDACREADHLTEANRELKKHKRAKKEEPK